MARYRNCNKKCCIVGIVMSSGFAILFHMLLICLIYLSIDIKDEIKGLIYSETPIYDLDFYIFKPGSDKNYIESFHEFKGREETKYDSSEKKDKIVIFGQTNITKIYQQYFVFKKDKRTYFDYLKEFTVDSGENCKENFKKCGIFNTQGKILCLPNGEECPLNDFAFSHINNDPNYNDYSSIDVSDPNPGSDNRFFYFTNKNVNGKIITKFKLSNGPPCYLSTESSWIPVFSNEHEKNPTCKTPNKDGNLIDENYFQIPGDGITIKSLYSDNDINTDEADPTKLNSVVNLYARNFYDKNENCINKYFSDIEVEENSYHDIEIKVRILNIISLLLILFLLIFSLAMCCCESAKIRWFF